MPDKPTTQRKRAGRRSKHEKDVTREAMIECAIGIAKKESLLEISMVRLAKELNVSPGLVHYHMNSRDELLSTVINAAIKERVQLLPDLTGDWKEDLLGICRSTLEAFGNWPGLATYTLSQNKFRLFQKVKPGEKDYGLIYFDHLGRVLKNSGLSPFLSALTYHLLLLFVSLAAVEKENRQAPEIHREFILKHVSELADGQYPGAEFLVEPFTRITNEKTFEAGIQFILNQVGALSGQDVKLVELNP